MPAKNVIPCRACRGLGTIALPEPYSDALDLFSRGIRLTASECLLIDASASQTAWSNRLRRMMIMGLLKREKVNREWIYEKI